MYQIGTNPNAPLGGTYRPENQQTASGQSSCNRPWRGDGVATGYPGVSGNATYANTPFGGFDGGSSSQSGGFSSVLSGFYATIQNLFAQLSSFVNGQNSGAGTGSTTAPANETAFKTATASSLGDPHLSFDGTSAAGTAQNGKWDSMSSHGDLLDSDSFAGGYQVSTTATTPQANGVAFNQSATVSTDDGATAVSFSHDGTLSVTQNGQAVSLAAGQSLSLGNGETVTSNQDGSATVSDGNGRGGTISTTMKSNGQGVDVTTTAKHADLGGYLVTGQDSQGVISPGAFTAGSGVAGSSQLGYEPLFAQAPAGSYAGAWTGTQLADSWQSNAGGWQSQALGAGSAASPISLTGFADPSIDEEIG